MVFLDPTLNARPDLAGFLASLDFVISQGMAADIQVFPLLILPSTYFRAHAGRLGLVYDPHPPQFLDQDLTLLYPVPGNRAIFFTLVSDLIEPVFQGEMERQVYLWQKENLPGESDMDDRHPHRFGRLRFLLPPMAGQVQYQGP